MHKPTASLRGIIEVGALAVCPVPQPILFSNAGDKACFLSFKKLFSSALPMLVGRVRGSWWLVSLGAIVTALCNPFCIFVVYQTLPVYEHSVQRLF